jgi:hypothetical protein
MQTDREIHDLQLFDVSVVSNPLPELRFSVPKEWMEAWYEHNRDIIVRAYVTGDMTLLAETEAPPDIDDDLLLGFDRIDLTR